MSEANPAAKASRGDGGRPGLGRGLTGAIVVAVLIGAAAMVYVLGGSIFKAPTGAASGDLRALAVGSMAKLTSLPEPSGPPPSAFAGPDGAPVRVGDFKGQVVVLNFWATWCAPCVKEMPTLAALQTAYAGKPVKVVALSQDQAEQTAKARTFIAANAPLAFYQDAKFAIAPEIKPVVAGFPTTILYDKRGVARAMLQGDADWSSPQARAVIDKLLAD